MPGELRIAFSRLYGCDHCDIGGEGCKGADIGSIPLRETWTERHTYDSPSSTAPWISVKEFGHYLCK